MVVSVSELRDFKLRVLELRDLKAYGTLLSACASILRTLAERRGTYCFFVGLLGFELAGSRCALRAEPAER